MASAVFRPALLLLLLLGSMMAHPREILVDDDHPGVEVGALRLEEEEADGRDRACHMEYQVVKRVAGTCIRLGRSARGCVAGNYLHPLHPECM